MMPLIDADYAWQIIRDASRLPADKTLTPTEGLTITADGAWQAGPNSVSEAAAALFDTLLPVARGGLSFVIAQLGQSLDGRIATASGHSYYVTGEASRVHLHRLRALVDAVIIGVGTLEADDPQLTVRHAPGVNPVRVVLDPNGRASAERRVFTDDGPPTWHVIADDVPALPGVATLRVAREADGRLDPAAVLAALAGRNVHRVLVEGGGQTISGFIAAGQIDRLHTVVAPMLIGSGRPGLSLPEIETLAEARRPACRDHPMGDDRLYDLDLRRTTTG
ncbi:deaminase [Salinisphaera japonica YTM-1]|uniref:Deaminase n=2 Tax=Salinisphaera TaxID=180541 RepID=A0A423Q2C5_9GAMM|nr:deaminase [Salinisphaera japonica YTM-1]